MNRHSLAIDMPDPEAVELIRERAELVNIFTKEIIRFREQAVGLDFNNDDAAGYLATRLVESMCY